MKSYPTWVYKGQKLESGGKTIQELAEIVGFSDQSFGDNQAQ